MENNLHNSNIFRTFEGWIGGSCKPSDKGNPTAFPRFNNLSEKTKIVGDMLRFEELPEINSERWLSLEDLPGEIWKPVIGREQKLLVSNYGRTKRKEYKLFYLGRWNTYREKIYRQHTLEYGHQTVSAMTCDKVETLSVHRLVAKAFLPNPENLPMINHKDENPRNNTVSNLEWCTALYNSNYGGCRDRIKMSKIHNKIAKAVVLYDLNGDVLKSYKTEHEAEKELCVSRNAIEKCCKGRYLTACGLYLSFDKNRLNEIEEDTEHSYYIKHHGMFVKLSSFTGEEIKLLLESYEKTMLCDNIYLKGKKCIGVKNLELVQIGNRSFLRIKKGRKFAFIYLREFGL